MQFCPALDNPKVESSPVEAAPVALEQTLLQISSNCFRAIRRNYLHLFPPLFTAVLVKLHSVSAECNFTRFSFSCLECSEQMTKGQSTAVHISSRIHEFDFKSALPVSVYLEFLLRH